MTQTEDIDKAYQTRAWVARQSLAGSRSSRRQRRPPPSRRTPRATPARLTFMSRAKGPRPEFADFFARGHPPLPPALSKTAARPNTSRATRARLTFVVIAGLGRGRFFQRPRPKEPTHATPRRRPHHQPRPPHREHNRAPLPAARRAGAGMA